MRRNVGLVVVGVGVFFLALAPLVRFYVGRQLIAAPLNVYQQTTLRADDATYLDTAEWTIHKGTTVTATNTTRGDVGAGDGKIAVWDSFTSIEDPAAKAKIEVQAQRAVFDRRTAELRNARGASVGDDSGVRQSGVGLFWPIGVKKQTYQYFDVTTKRAWPMTYEGEEKIHGINAYRFVQQVPPTVTESVKPGVPASLFGVNKTELARIPGYDKKNNAVAVDRVYQATVTAWVDPRTGAPVSQEQKVKQTLRTSDGTDRLVIADLDLKMTDASQRSLVTLSDHEALKIALVRDYVPLGGAGLGIVLLVVGLVLAIPGRQTIIPVSTGDADGSRPAGREPSA
ncbi:MAG: hypothetical protein JWR24_872 [Actinoallomurus sp.]|nr:hypothetical protein [Actinoallomurus sp.]